MARSVPLISSPNGWLQTQAPLFETMTSDGKIVSLEKALSSGAVILLFYPGDETPLARWFLESFQAIQEASDEPVHVFGVGPGNKESHERFRKRSHLPFSLLMDEQLSIARLYGATQHTLNAETVQTTTVGIRSLDRIHYYKNGLSKPIDTLKSLRLYVSHRKTS